MSRVPGRMIWACLVCVLVPLTAGAQASTSFPVTAQYGEDNDPPTVPDPVTVTPVAVSQIDVSWGASNDAFTGVAGYQVFRDAVQIATTSQTNYSDVGLQASTTYSYTVTAFDQSGNFSSSSVAVATTTLAPPPPPPPAPPEPDSPPVYGQAPKPSVEDLEVVPGAQSAQITFHTPMFTQYELRYGTTPTYDSGLVSSGVYRVDHSTFLTQLEPNTTYYYELFVSDRFGQEAVVDEGSFVTEPSVVVTRPSNVFDLQADVVGRDVLLQWQMPDAVQPTYVRVVRNRRFFPTDPWDGTVLYEGTDESFTDAAALQDYDGQYYSIFTFNLDGDYSSGAVVHATRQPTDPLLLPPLLQPDATTTSSTSAGQANVPEQADTPVWPQFTDIEAVQNGRIITAPADTLTIDTNEPFVLRIPYDTVPEHLKVVMVTLGMPKQQSPQASYLLRANAEKTYYEAELSALDTATSYPLRLSVYDVTEERLVTIGGTIVAAGEEVGPVRESWWHGLLYLGGMFLLGVGLGGVWWWLVVWWRRRNEKHRSTNQDA